MQLTIGVMEMYIVLRLLYKILQLSVVMLLGFILVKAKILKSNDCKVLSKISLYLLLPAVIINAFDMEMTTDIVKGLELGFVAAIAIHIIFLIVDVIYKKLFHGTSVERASIVYSNAGNLIVPIVMFVLGEEWLVYSCTYLSVQVVFFWTHGIQLFSTQKLNLKKILLNINIISIIIGAVIMLSGLRLPTFVKEITSSLGGMVGNIGMLIAGMLAAEVDFKKVLANKRLYLALGMRMLVCPFLILVLLKVVYPILPIANADKILLISFLACITPAAATVMQFAQLYDKEADFAVAVNIVSTVVCIVTMPIFVALY